MDGSIAIRSSWKKAEKNKERMEGYMIINIICMLVFACVVAGIGIFILEHTDSNSIRAVTILGCLGLVMITGVVVFTNENYHQFLQNEEKKIEMCKNNPIEKTIYQDSEMETITIVQDRLNDNSERILHP